MKRRLLAILLMMCICMSCVAYAESTPEIDIENITAVQGEEVTIAVKVKNNPGFAAMMVELAYDSNKLTPLSVSSGSVTNNASVVSNIQQGGDMKQYNPVTFFVVNPSDFTGDGEVFLVTFSIDETAESGKTELLLSYEKEAIANQNYEDVDFKINQGSILINTENDDERVEADHSNKNIVEENKNDEVRQETQTVETKEENVITKVEPQKKDITITIDGKDIKFDQPPVIVNDRTLVPMRAIFEALGAVVDWENDSRTAVGTKDGVTIRIQIDNNVMKKDGSDIVLDVPAQLVNNRTLVPIRAVSESFGCKVDWVDSTRTVVILTK